MFSYWVWDQALSSSINIFPGCINIFPCCLVLATLCAKMLPLLIRASVLSLGQAGSRIVQFYQAATVFINYQHFHHFVKCICFSYLLFVGLCACFPLKYLKVDPVHFII